MGVVFRAREIELDRDVAVKLLLDKFTTDSDIAARFLEEARITAQLQHPNIPPVHRIGKLPNGRPYLVMKLIKGKTLDKLLEERCGVGTDRGPFIAIFEAIAQAVAYSHQRRVIHRDLKPGNVMVGAFGEVQVMDWGLAKVLTAEVACVSGASAAPDYTVIHNPRPANDEGTQDGEVQGTPAFMPPEQAAGETARIAPPSDVFSLGAILCSVLTGQPPYLGRSNNEKLVKAIRGDTGDAFARLDACGADPELVALAKWCLAADPVKRPADADQVAKTVADWRLAAEERARQAERERAAKDAAEAGRDRAKQLYVLALTAFNQTVFDIQGRLEKSPGTLDLRRELLKNARDGLQQLVGEAEKHGTPDRTLIWSHFRMGDVELVLGNTLTALQEYEAGHRLARRLAEANPDDVETRRDLSVSFEKLGNVTLKLGRLDEARDLYAQDLEITRRLAEANPDDVEARRDLSVSFEKLGNVTLKLGHPDKAHALYVQGLEIRQRLADADPGNALAQRDLGFSFSRLGNVMLKKGRMDEAHDFYTKGLEIRQSLASADPGNAQAQRDLGFSFSRLGNVALEMGRTDEAHDFYKKGLEVSLRLAEADPNDAQAQSDLLWSYKKLGNLHQESRAFAGAIEFYTLAITIARKFARPEYFAKDIEVLDGRVKACQKESEPPPPPTDPPASPI
ncbi:MAG: serine/threonine protein kinase [Planctomycetes bacterium]|nr:serine/threonine protein kinase [Planctomycetota bacterium]